MRYFPNFRVQKHQIMSHTNVSLFSQILGLVNRNVFNSCVKKHESDKHSKGINTWTHMASMIFMQMAGASSLRDISNGLLYTTPQSQDNKSSQLVKNSYCSKVILL